MITVRYIKDNDVYHIFHDTYNNICYRVCINRKSYIALYCIEDIMHTLGYKNPEDFRNLASEKHRQFLMECVEASFMAERFEPGTDNRLVVGDAIGEDDKYIYGEYNMHGDIVRGIFVKNTEKLVFVAEDVAKNIGYESLEDMLSDDVELDRWSAGIKSGNVFYLESPLFMPEKKGGTPC